MLDTIGKHSELQKKMKETDREPTTVFPANTSEDVYVDEDGHTLDEFLPTIDGNPIVFTDGTNVEVDEELAALLLA